MAQPTYVRSPEPQAGEIVYRPVSVLAISGLALAALYAFIILGAGIVAFFRSQPLKLGAWTFLFPVAAACLSVAGWWQVRTSEGTRVGLGLARWGVRLSLLFGLGYGAYLMAIGMALGMETDQYARKWFDKLREGDINSAFLYTIDPQKREGIRPNNAEDMARFTTPSQAGASAMENFENSQLVRLVRQGGDQAEIEHLGMGVSDWEYALEGYLVRQSYRVRTREGEFDFVLTLRSSPERAGRKGPRQWFLVHSDLIGSGKPSEFGATVAVWSKQASDFTNKWMAKLGRGDLSGAYWETQDPVERDRQAPAYRQNQLRAACMNLGVGHAGGLAEEATLLAARQWSGEKQLTRDVRLFGDKGLFQWTLPPSGSDEESLKKAEKFKKEMLDILEGAFAAPPGKYLMVASPSSSWSRWEEVGTDRFRFSHDYQVVLMEKDVHKGYRYNVKVWVEDDPGPTDLERLPEWRIDRIEITDAGVMMEPDRKGPAETPAPIGSPLKR